MTKQNKTKQNKTKQNKTKQNYHYLLTNLLSFKLFIVVFSLILFSVSCGNDDKTGTEERTLSYYAGNWWGNIGTEKHLLTINTDSSITVKIGGDDVIISSSSVTRVSDTSYIASYHDSTANKNAKFTFIFSSDTQGKFTMEQGGSPATLDITKK